MIDQKFKIDSRKSLCPRTVFWICCHRPRTLRQKAKTVSLIAKQESLKSKRIPSMMSLLDCEGISAAAPHGTPLRTNFHLAVLDSILDRSHRACCLPSYK